MRTSTIWLLYLLLVVLCFAIPMKLHAQNVKIAECQENGYCIISAEMLNKIVGALEHWYEQAKTCRGA